MLTLGLAGGLDPVHEARLDALENVTFDGAAVLVEDGSVVAAVEEARVDRIKRSNKFPGAAVRFCLEQRGVGLEEVDRIAYYANEEAVNQMLSRLYLTAPDAGPRRDARAQLAATLGRETGAAVDPARLRFFQHKLTHAAGAMAQSGFDEALVLVLDNFGGLFAGRRDDNGAVRLEEIAAMPPAKSTTRLCLLVNPFLGLSLVDEPRAVAMAPQGDPGVFRPLFRSCYELLPGGDYTLRLDRLAQLAAKVEPRGQGEPTQQHKDLAAALQETLEEIILHVLRHQHEARGERNLCLAGGIVENSITNGKVLAAGLFDQVFVHPAAHDAGCALGAALLASEEAGCPSPRQRLRHAYWGTDAGADGHAAAELERWQGFLTFERDPDVARRTAALLEQGALVGWVQGRSEFSSRSLGNRSVLADPRNAGNRERVEAALRRPSGLAPIGPSVLEEEARSLFQVPEGTSSSPYMAFAVEVREDGRDKIAATVGADGTAWLQTVSRETNPRFWELIHAFQELTGVPALLNTSFSSRLEPIVDSVEDAVVCFLTTGLDYLVIDDFVAHKRTPAREDLLSLRVSLPPYVRLQKTRSFVTAERMATRHEIRTSYDARLGVRVSSELFDLLMKLEDEPSLGELLQAGGVDPTGEQALLQELDDLWSQRLVRLRGGRAAGPVA